MPGLCAPLRSPPPPHAWILPYWYETMWKFKKQIKKKKKKVRSCEQLATQSSVSITRRRGRMLSCPLEVSPSPAPLWTDRGDDIQWPDPPAGVVTVDVCTRLFFLKNIIILCLISTFILINTEPSTVIFSLYSDFISLMIDTCRIYGSTSQQYDQLEKEKRGKKEKEKTLKKQTNKTSDDKIDTTTTTSSKALVDGSLLLGYFVLLRQIFIFSFQICINLYLENVTVNQWDWCKLKVPGVSIVTCIPIHFTFNINLHH